jgi:dsRNA-specific ribonuclease
MDSAKVKSLLESYCKENRYKKPKYIVISKTNVKYRDYYGVSVEVKGVLTVEGFGISKRLAEKNAAIKALIKFNVIKEEDIRPQEVDNKEIKINNNELKVPTNNEDFGYNNEGLVVDENSVKANDSNSESKNDFDNNSSLFLSSEQNSEQVLNSSSNEINKSNDSIDGEIFKEEINAIESNKANTEISKFGQFENNNAISLLIEFCLKKRIPIPFYDYNYNKGVFCCQCRIEFNYDNWINEFIGLGTGDNLKSAKIAAAEHVINQLQENNLFFDAFQRKNGVKNEFEFNGENNNELNIDESYDKRKIMKSKSQELCCVESNDHKLSAHSFESLNIVTEEKTNEDFEKNKTTNECAIEGSEKFSQSLQEISQNENNSKADDNNNRDNHINTPIIVCQDFRIKVNNPIGYLQEFSFKNSLKAPEYSEELKTGEENCPLFIVKCVLNVENREIVGWGSGKRKRSAKKAAAGDVVRKIVNC